MMMVVKIALGVALGIIIVVGGYLGIGALARTAALNSAVIACGTEKRPPSHPEKAVARLPQQKDPLLYPDQPSPAMIACMAVNGYEFDVWGSIAQRSTIWKGR